MKKKKATRKKAARRAPAKMRDKKGARAPKRSRKMDPDAMMEMWQKSMTPGQGHAALEPLVGSFRVRTTFLTSKGAEPAVSEGTADYRWVLGGRYLEQRYLGGSMGDVQFEGIGYLGYENSKRRYIGTWMDNFGTGFLNSRGTGKPTPHAIEFEAMEHEPSGKVMKSFCKLTIQDGDHHSFERWTLGPNRYRSILIEYIRK